MATMISGFGESGGCAVQIYGGSRPAGTGSKPSAFAREMQRREAGSASTQDELDPREMSMEEYKQHIARKIRQIPIHPSRRDEYISVTISEEGYAAMKNDPEYEAWVLNDLRCAWSRPSFCFGGGDRVYTHIHYGATQEECHADTWTVPVRRASDGARERREEYRRRLEKRIKKQKLQRQLREIVLQRQLRQRAWIKKLIRHRQEMEKENRQRWKKTALKDKPDGSRVLETTTKKKTIQKITERDVIRVEEVLREMQLQQEKLFSFCIDVCEKGVLH